MVGTNNDVLQYLLRQWMPVMESHTEATHLTEGFHRKENGWDRLLSATKDAIKKQEEP